MRRSGSVTSLAVALAVVLASAPAAQAAVPGEQLQGLLEAVVREHRLVPGATLYVDAPRLGAPWQGAAGFVAKTSAQPLSPDDPFRIASVQKVFTGAAVLRLVEDRRLDLDAPVAPYLDADQVDRMHVHGGVNHGRRITIRQLLRHTSGLNSHDQCPEFAVAVASGPRRHWTPRELIELMISCGDPSFAPDAPGRWRYSDTGFVMLSLVLSKVTGKSYAGALRELLPLEELGLRSTWHELSEPARAAKRPRAHQYVAALDLTDWNPSFDSWGGGGYASTVRDVTTFVRALFDGRVFRHPSTLRWMTSTVPVDPQADRPLGNDAYGLGLGRFTFGRTQCWGHAGFWSVIALYCPSLDLAFAGTTNQAQDEHVEQHSQTDGFLSRPVVDIVRRATRG